MPESADLEKQLKDSPAATDCDQEVSARTPRREGDGTNDSRQDRFDTSSDRLTPLALRVGELTLLAGIIALLEFLAMLGLAGRYPRLVGGMFGHVLALAANVFVWVLPLSATSLVHALSSGLPSAWMRRAIQGIGSFALGLLVVASTAGWFFYSRSGVFLTRDLVDFFLGNAAQVSLHFIQSFPLLLAGVILGCAGLGTLLWRVVATVHVPTRVASVGVVGVAITSIMLALSVAVSPLGAQGASHPLLAAAMTPEVATLSHGFEPAELRRVALRPLAPLSQDAPRGRPPVIVILVESFRRDLLDMIPTPIPNLRKIAAQSIVFDKSYAASSHSDLADLSVWYSRYPLRSPSFSRDYPVNAPWKGSSVFAAYRAAGYHTAYISSQNELWGQMINWLKVPEVEYFFHSEYYRGKTWVNRDDRNGLVRYLDAKVATAGKVEDSETFRIARDWLDTLPEGGKTNFFLGMNLQNTHFHYVVPEGSPEPFQPSVMDFPAVYYTWPQSRVTDVKNRYLNAVFNLDAIIADFVEDLKRRGVWDDCYFVIVGDSGEAFYEHGFGNHSGPAFDEAMRTLTFIKPPRAQRGLMVTKPISHIDVVPYLLSAMGMEVPASMQGIPLAESPPNPRVFMVVAAMVKQTSILHWPWKLMLNHYPADPPQLFNLEADPAEQDNVATREPEILEGMTEELRAWHSGQFAYYARPEIFERYGPPRWH